MKTLSDSAYLVDTSVWIALAFPTHPHHRQATDAAASFSVQAPAIFCRATQQSFLRLITTPAIQHVYGAESLTNEDAWAALARFLAAPAIAYRDEPPGLFASWRNLATRQNASPKVWMDAYLAAFAICAGHRLVTIDKAFNQYAGLDLQLLATE